MRRALVLGLLVLAATGWLLGWSPYLRVATISVEGAQTLSRSDVEKASGILIGQPLARISSARVERGFTSIPRIKKFSLIRQWPDSITIRIQERIPLARVGDRVVDSSGVLFPLAAGEKAPTMDIAASKNSNIKAWVAIYRQLPNRSTVTEADLRDMENISFMMSGVHVIWGSTEESATKIRVLSKLGLDKWASIDLSAPLAPTTTAK